MWLVWLYAQAVWRFLLVLPFDLTSSTALLVADPGSFSFSRGKSDVKVEIVHSA
jgi:hypothetical protein